MSPLIPVHLLLGTLGSGKTTTVLELLGQMPSGERWAVLINEFGSVGLDKAIVEEGRSSLEGGVRIYEAPGGCICCSGQSDLEEGIRTLIGEHRPDRILIEPTGLVDAENLVGRLEEKGPAWGIALHSVIGHMDVRLFRNRRIMDVPFWKNLIHLSDRIIAAKADLAHPEAVEAFTQAMVSRKNRNHILLDRSGLLDSDWKSPCRRSENPVWLFEGPEGFQVSRRHQHEGSVSREFPVMEGKGKRHETVSMNHYTIGWVVDPDCRFSFCRLKDWLEDIACSSPSLLRLKGIIRTRQGWVGVQMVQGDRPTFVSARPRKDSRLEIIAGSDTGDWKVFEQLILEDPVIPAVTDDLH